MHAAGTPFPASTADAVTVSSLPESGELDPGTYLVTGFTVPFEITVPDDWESGGWFLFKSLSDEAGVAVNFQMSGYVPTDACSWRGAIVEVDPSPEAFAAAMAAQTSTVTTPAVEIMVGGFSGLEFDHSVESDLDITDCDEEKICLHSDSAHQLRALALLCDRARDIQGGRPERRAGCDCGPRLRIRRSGADSRGTRRVRLDRVRARQVRAKEADMREPALPRRSRRAPEAGRRRCRIAGVLRSRRVHRDRDASARVDCGGSRGRTSPGAR